MLRGFLVIFILCGIAILAVFGFRGQRSTAPPTEVFPDMVRQMKVRAQAPLNLFADGRGPRLPVVGTVPIGYEMPRRGQLSNQGSTWVPGPIPALILVPVPITTIPAKWAITGEQVFRFRSRAT